MHDGISPSNIAFAGESAGGGLAVATLVNARDHGLPLPAAAFVMSPYADLTLAGTTMETRREVDPLLSRESLQARVPDYTAGQDAALGLISPIFADLSGLPPLIIQAGTHEVLLDDAVRLAQQAVTADVEVTLDITPRVPHVFQKFTRSSTRRPPRWTEPDHPVRALAGVGPAVRGRSQMKLGVNGAEVDVDDRHANDPAAVGAPRVLGLSGTKFGCGAGFCAACTVLVDGRNTKSCQTATERAVGKAVTTVEGASGPVVDAVRDAWHAATSCSAVTASPVKRWRGVLARADAPPTTRRSTSG